MAHAGSSVFTVPRPVPWRFELDPIVIWLSGERDIATDGALRLAVARSMASGPAALAMEPSGVELMSVSTLETIARAREPLWHRSRSLTVRGLSRFRPPHHRQLRPNGPLWPPGGQLGKVAQPLGGSAGARRPNRLPARLRRGPARPPPAGPRSWERPPSAPTGARRPHNQGGRRWSAAPQVTEEMKYQSWMSTRKGKR